MPDPKELLNQLDAQFGEGGLKISPEKLRAQQLSPQPAPTETVGEAIKRERASEEEKVKRELERFGLSPTAGEVKLPPGSEYAATVRGTFTSPAALEAAKAGGIGAVVGFLTGGPAGAGMGALEAAVPVFAGESVRGEVPAQYKSVADIPITVAEMLTPSGFANLARRLEKPILHGAQGDIARYATAFENQGGRIYPGQLTLPKGALFSERNARVVNRMVTRSAGNEAATIDEAWFNNTRQMLSDTYENNIYAPNNYFVYSPGQANQIQNALAVPMNAVGEAAPVIDRYRQRLVSAFPGMFEPQFIPAPNGGGFIQNPRYYGTYSGQEWQRAQDIFREAARSSNFDVRNWARNLDATIRSTSRALDPQVNALLNETNARWRSLRVLEDMKEANAINRGFVDAQKLGARLNAEDPTFKGRGPRSDLELAGKVGENLNVQTVPLTAEQLEAQRKGGEKVGGVLGGLTGLGTGALFGGGLSGTAVSGITGERIGRYMGGAAGPPLYRLSQDVLGPVGRTMQRGDVTRRFVEPGVTPATAAIGSERAIEKARKMFEERERERETDQSRQP